MWRNRRGSYFGGGADFERLDLTLPRGVEPGVELIVDDNGLLNRLARCRSLLLKRYELSGGVALGPTSLILLKLGVAVARPPHRGVVGVLGIGPLPQRFE